MISLVLSFSCKFGECLHKHCCYQVILQCYPHVVLICQLYGILIQQICNSGNSDSTRQLSVVQQFVAQYQVI